MYSQFCTFVFVRCCRCVLSKIASWMLNRRLNTRVRKVEISIISSSRDEKCIIFSFILQNTISLLYLLNMFRRSSVLIKKYVLSAVAETNQAKSIKSRMYNVPDTREDYQVYILRLAYPMCIYPAVFFKSVPVETLLRNKLHHDSCGSFHFHLTFYHTITPHSKNGLLLRQFLRGMYSKRATIVAYCKSAIC